MKQTHTHNRTNFIFSRRREQLKPVFMIISSITSNLCHFLTFFFRKVSSILRHSFYLTCWYFTTLILFDLLTFYDIHSITSKCWFLSCKATCILWPLFCHLDVSTRSPLLFWRPAYPCACSCVSESPKTLFLQPILNQCFSNNRTVSLNETVNVLTMCLSNQLTSWYHIMTLHLIDSCLQKRSLCHH